VLLQQAFAIYFPSARVTAVRSAEDALAAYDQGGADLFLTDHHMPPGMSGLELIQALRSRRVTVPVVMVSGDDQLEADALAVGATSFMAKGGALAPMVRAVTALLR
jgi:two-component system response regulator RegX3